MDSKRYIELLFPNGRAFASVEDSEKYNEVLAMQIDKVLAWIQDFQDQLWYVNDNFNPEPWELRYNINVPEFSTLEQRRIIVKSYMAFPQSQNRLSLDYIQGQLNLAGFTNVIVSTNEIGYVGRYIHANNISCFENFLIGTDTYNSILISGSIDATYYLKMLLLIMSLKPLDTVVYDDVDVYTTIALDDTLAIAIPTDVYFVSKFGSSGTGNGQFTTPIAIAVTDTNIYVIDTYMDNVQIFDLSGTFVSKFGSTGTGNGQFTTPTAFAVTDTNIYVVDSDRDDVQIFDLSGTFVSKFGSTGLENGQFTTPIGIAVTDTNIYVADNGRDDVQILI